LRIAVVSPIVDRRHGTERAIAELVERLAHTYHCEVHLFAQAVADLKLSSASASAASGASGGSITWRRVPAVPGPQLLRFAAWFLLNRWQRAFDDFDLVVSPGINCFDANVIIVHALFHRLAEVGAIANKEPGNSPGLLRRLHRRAYYSLLSFLERRIYGNRNVVLAAVSSRTGALLAQYFQRTDIRVIPNGVDSSVFTPASRLARRQHARSVRQLEPDHFVLLLIGNDWATKGLFTIFQAMASLTTRPIRLMVVGSDASAPHRNAARELGILERCIWEAPAADVLDCYAAADLYVSPSREDSFGLPVLEAMACGLPAITSSSAGVSELMTNSVDGFVLQNPRDAAALAQQIAQLYDDSSLRSALQEAAVRTARDRTWDRNAAQVWELLSEVAATKRRQ